MERWTDSDSRPSTSRLDIGIIVETNSVGAGVFLGRFVFGRFLGFLDIHIFVWEV